MPKKSRISPALSRIAQRGMTVSEDEIRLYQPGEMDLLICEAMLSGALTFQEIAESIGRSPPTVSNHLKDPVLCAWISRAVHQQIHTRLGMLDAAMFRRALAGDVRAYEALMKRYGKSANLNITAHVGGGENYDLMSDKALDALLKRRTAAAAVDTEAEVEE